MICKHCGREIPEGVAYCGNCGARTKKSGFPWILVSAGIVMVLVLLVALAGRRGTALPDPLPTEPAVVRVTESRQEETAPSVEDSEDVSLPAQTEAEPTEESKPAQTEAELTDESFPQQDRLPSVSGKLRDHVLLRARDTGACRKLVGDVVVTVVFAQVPEGSWSAEERSAVTEELKTRAQFLMDAAKEYGAELNLRLEFTQATAPTCAYGEEDAWATEALDSMGLGTLSQVDARLQAQYQADAAPVVFYMNTSGRSRASWSGNPGDFEYAILYQTADSFCHELCHLFGAVDYYYPQSVIQAAKEWFPESLMLDSENESVDPLTAYLLGWTDVLTPEGESFLARSADLTWEDYQKSVEDQYFTGETTWVFSFGTYTGELVDGLMHGQGKLVWNSGRTYEGSWAGGQMDGWGVMTWEDGSWYEGEWKDGERNGQGTYTWSNGAVYRGQWAGGKRSGQGTLTFANGTVQSGQWKDDEFQG